MRNRNNVAILLDDVLREHVVEVKRANNSMISIKLVIRGSFFSTISVNAPHIGLDEKDNKIICEDLDERV